MQTKQRLLRSTIAANRVFVHMNVDLYLIKYSMVVRSSRLSNLLLHVLWKW